MGAQRPDPQGRGEPRRAGRSEALTARHWTHTRFVTQNTILQLAHGSNAGEVLQQIDEHRYRIINSMVRPAREHLYFSHSTTR